MQIYNLLTTEISDSFSCLFKFDSYTKTINVFTIDEIGIPTNIVLSNKNILKSWVKDDSTDSIITKIIVKGGDDGSGGNVSIRAVNFGRNYLFNPSYFMNTNWVSQGLVTAWQNYTIASDSALTSYTNTLNTLKVKNNELLVLEVSLTDLESLKKSQDNVIGASVQLHGRVPIPSDSDYTIYQNAITLSATYTSQIVSKKSAISTKKSEIIVIEETLNSISGAISESNYFTTAHLSELNLFISEGEDFEDSSFIATSIMTPTEVIDMKLELKQNAANELFKISQPQYTFKINASNLFSLQDDKDELIPYIEFRDSFDVGNIITLKLTDTFWITVRIMSMTVDFDNPSEIELTFSNKDRLEDELILLAEMLAESGRAASAYSMKSFGYNGASKQTSTVRDFMSGSLNATLNALKSNDDQEFLIDGFGAHMRKWLSDQNKYHGDQSWWNQNVLMFTENSWNTSSTAIGRLNNPSGTGTYWGINTEVLVGKLFLGEKLKIINDSGNYTIDNLGFTATSTVGVNTYSVGINPSTPSEIINVKVNGINQLYIDVNTNKLIFNGTLSATAINAQMINALNVTAGSVNANWVYAGTLTAQQVNAVDIIADSVSSTWVYAGNISASQITAGTISADRVSGGTLSGTTITSVGASYSTTITNGYISTGYVSLMSGANSTYILPNSIQVGNADSTLYITANSIYGNGVTFLTSGNYSSWCASSGHSHSSSQISAVDTGFGNIDMSGFDNAMGVQYAASHYQPITTSDERLKNTVGTMSNIPIDLFMDIKLKQFNYKFDSYGNGINFGVYAQELENTFTDFGLNPNDYNLFSLIDIRKDTDEGLYIEDKVHIINYSNLFVLTMDVVQRQEIRIKALENIIFNQ